MLKHAHAVLHRMPSGIWALGLVSMFMDISSELVHSLLPIFMSSVLGASMTTIGVVEGVAEATAAFSKFFSGFFSDWSGKRKAVALFGYGLSTLTKPVFPLASSIGWVLFARVADRVGKGIRGAPRDALVAELSPPELRGAAFGLRQSLDSVGAFIGPLLAVLLMLLLANNITMVLWLAVLPAVAAVIILALWVHDPEGKARTGKSSAPVLWADLKRLHLHYWLVVCLGAVFTLARFSEAFLVLRAENTGLSLAFIPMVMVVMSLAYAIVSLPAGIASDRFRASSMLVAGLFVLVLADLQLASADSAWSVLIGSALWGMHMGLTQGLLSKLVADSTPAHLHGSAFGLFNLISGLALLMASIIAGMLWDKVGPSATFLCGALFAGTAMLGVIFHRGLSRHSH
ncbi:MFS transporter [Mariprofundus ferrooxydans]|uniref:Major facilitator superfamily transporter n=1 Tax=Mariprofundus ferrooxydans PV-1 TaxID=314345 RepID=Q0EWK2_9PROT|nr:MFS transporter [Mariprofundus ferrooxydans]EAU53675.1 major facilitator superfamily transporter [Mariprofundus ferrooxydans PV-1]KON47302.1 MFS transporter [Mariprofundus ferrooxydans]